jgi:hypothetical protein
VTSEQEETSTTYHMHTQHATKILSSATTLEELQSKNSMAEDIADLKERNVELMSIINEMKEYQHRDQKKLIGLESELENTKRKVDTGVNEIRECRSALAKVETRLASLSTKEDTTSRFDRIEAILMGNSHTPKLQSREQMKLLTGKRKEKTDDYENELELNEDENGPDSQEPMETEQTIHTILAHETQTGEGDHTNSQIAEDTTKMRLK